MVLEKPKKSRYKNCGGVACILILSALAHGCSCEALLIPFACELCDYGQYAPWINKISCLDLKCTKMGKSYGYCMNSGVI